MLVFLFPMLFQNAFYVLRHVWMVGTSWRLRTAGVQSTFKVQELSVDCKMHIVLHILWLLVFPLFLVHFPSQKKKQKKKNHLWCDSNPVQIIMFLFLDESERTLCAVCCFPMFCQPVFMNVTFVLNQVLHIVYCV